MATTAVAIDKVTLTIDTLDISPDLVKGTITPKANSSTTITTADGGKVLLPGEATTWTLELTVLVNDTTGSFLRAKCFTKAGQTVNYTALIKNGASTTSTVSGTCILQPGEIVFGDPWGATQQTKLTLDATVATWA